MANILPLKASTPPLAQSSVAAVRHFLYAPSYTAGRNSSSVTFHDNFGGGLNMLISNDARSLDYFVGNAPSEALSQGKRDVPNAAQAAWFRYEVPEQGAVRPCAALVEPTMHRIVVPYGHGDGVRSALPQPSDADVIETDVDVFEQLAARASPTFGKHKIAEARANRIRPDEMEAMGYQMVPADLLTRARIEVEKQAATGHRKDWCCGPNSAARASIMLGRPKPNMDWFYDNCPKNRILGWQWGPDPRQMAGFLRRCGEFSGIYVRPVRVDHWHEFERFIDDRLAWRRPIIVLFVWGQTAMHWSCLVGRSPDKNTVAILGTNGELFLMPTDVLRHEMQSDVAFGAGLKGFNGVDFPMWEVNYG